MIILLLDNNLVSRNLSNRIKTLQYNILNLYFQTEYVFRPFFAFTNWLPVMLTDHPL